jgi:hypothetical protein
MTRRGALVQALGLYIGWTGATYLLEGRPRTFLRPEEPALRLTYALVANVLIGTVLSVWLARRLVRGGVASTSELGFRRLRHAAAAVAVASGLGLAGYVLQDPPTLNPIVLLNGFAQVLVVSMAEVLVCWVLVGGTIWAALRPYGAAPGPVAFVLVSAVSFGLYHYAHSPPFNTLRMALFLSGVGVATGIFFVVSRDVYGTVAFHNWLGLFGVLQALERADRLETLAVPRWPLLATAGLAVGTVAFLHWWWLRRTLRE